MMGMLCLSRLLVAFTIAVPLLGDAPVSPYFPLTVGTTWNLGDGTTSLKLSVTGQSVVAGTPRATVRFQNPWVSYDMLMRSTTAGILLEGIQFDSVRNGYPTPAMLFGSGSVGQKWSSPFMTSTLVSINNTVSTPAGTFTGVARFDIAFGNSIQTWYLSPSYGFVQFGVTGPQKLLSYTFAPPPVAAAAKAVVPCPKVGIEPNPPANGDFSTAGKKTAFLKAVSAGANFLYVSPTWAQLEPSPGRYDFSSISNQLAWANTAGVEVVMTIKTIDTLSRTLPADLQNKAWNDPAVLQRWQGVVGAVCNYAKRLKWLNLGNEVDIYLLSHTSEIAGYYTFVDSGQRAAAGILPSTSIGLVFAFDSYQLNDLVFRSLEPLLRHVSFTYYAGDVMAPGGVGQRNPSEVPFDMATMIAAAKGKPLVLTEIGYSSSSQIGSSPALQQTFYANVFSALSVNANRVSGGSFSFMSDIPANVANQFSSVYGASVAWVSWFQNLGALDGQGVGKPAWNTFQTQAKAFALPAACRAN